MERPHVFHIALAQMTSVDDLNANLEVIDNLIRKAKLMDPLVQMVCFPENALYMRIQEGAGLPTIQLTDPAFQKLQAVATELRLVIHLGSVALTEGDRVFNSSVVIRPHQSAEASYRKIHLFDIKLEGDKAIRESDVFSGGDAPAILEVDGWRFGQSICYDVRFSELYRTYAMAEVDGILIPSAFLAKTGLAHWHVLNRARAIESQAYVVSSAQSGKHLSTRPPQEGKLDMRETFGHAMIIDPWGQTLVELKDQVDVVTHVLSRDRIHQVRRQIPMKDHRRLK